MQTAAEYIGHSTRYIDTQSVDYLGMFAASRLGQSVLKVLVRQRGHLMTRRSTYLQPAFCRSVGSAARGAVGWWLRARLTLQGKAGQVCTAGTDAEVFRRELHTCVGVPSGNARGPNGSAAHERIQHTPAFRRDGQQIRQPHGLGCEMVFACRVYGVAVQPGQALKRIA